MGGKLDQGVGALKKGRWNPFMNYVADCRLFIPAGINEKRYLMECNSNCNRKAITVGTNIYSIGLNNQWKLNETTIYIYTSFGKKLCEFSLD